MTTTTIPKCPDCEGPWLEAWRWQHVPLRRCPLRAADDTTQAADAERVTGRAPLIRPSTAAEARLWEFVTGTVLPPGAVTVVHAGGYWGRAINGFTSAAEAAAAQITTNDPEGNTAA